MRGSETRRGTVSYPKRNIGKNNTKMQKKNQKEKRKKQKQNKPRVCRVGSYPETMKKVKLASIKEGA